MRRALVSLASCVLLAGGCSRATTDTAGVATTEQDEIFLAVCGGRRPCSIESQLPLGQSADGRTLSVIVTRSPKRRPTTEPDIAEALAEQPWKELSAIGDGPAARRECTPWWTWLVSRSPVAGTRAQLLAARCVTDDSGRAPVVEQSGPGEVRSTLTGRADNQEGKPAAGYSETVETLELGIEPPRALRIARRIGYGHPGVAPVPDRESSWDWEAFRGHACWHGHDDCGELLPVAHVADDAYGSGAWKTTALGQCALLIDGTPSHGVAEPPGSPTASVRVLLADDVLYLEVTDDVFVTRGSVVDAIEVVWSSYEAKPGDHPSVERLTMDGKLTLEHVTHPIEVAEAGPNTRRFAVKSWPPAMGSWSLSYVDTDDGRTVRQRISSVPWSNDRGQTVLRVEPQPTCTPRDQVLRVRPATATDEDKGIVR